jgi:hypothetical protein
MSPQKNSPAPSEGAAEGGRSDSDESSDSKRCGVIPTGDLPKGENSAAPERNPAKAESKFSVSPPIGGFAEKSFFDSAQNKSDFVQRSELLKNIRKIWLVAE